MFLNLGNGTGVTVISNSNSSSNLNLSVNVSSMSSTNVTVINNITVLGSPAANVTVDLTPVLNLLNQLITLLTGLLGGGRKRRSILEPLYILDEVNRIGKLLRVRYLFNFWGTKLEACLGNVFRNIRASCLKPWNSWQL